MTLLVAILAGLLLAFFYGRILGVATLDPPFLLVHLSLTFPLVHHEHIQHLGKSFARHGVVNLESDKGFLVDSGKFYYKVPNNQHVIELS